MASFPTSIHFIILFVLTFFFNSITAATSNSSFSFTNFNPNSRFQSLISLHGDAKVADDGLALQLTAPLQSSAGRVIYKNPIKFYGGNPRKLVSFSTFFSFSISSGYGVGDGLAFVVVSDGFPVDLFDGNGSFGLALGEDLKVLSVEFGTSMDDKNGIHLGIDLSNFVSVNVANVSNVNLGLNSGEKLQAWIDYESMSRRLEVRLSKFGENRPIDPILFERIDLPQIWPANDGYLVGLSSFNRNSTQLCNVYSWSFITRQAPDWMHSEPLDPILLKQKEENEVKSHKTSDCVLRVLSALILGVVLGALGSFVGMFVWTIFAKRQPISPEEYGVKDVVHDKASANGKQ